MRQNTGVINSGNTDEGFNWDFSDIPKDWLEEIEEGPVSARDWVIDKYDLDGTCERDLLTKNIDCNGFDCVEIYEAGAADNELRHRPHQIFEEWQNERKHGFAATAHEAWLRGNCS